MINLKDFRNYWEQMLTRVPELRSVEMISVEANMANKVSKIDADRTPTLFYMPPTASAMGDADAWREENKCVIFIMQKYNPNRQTSAEVLEQVQPVVEAVKRLLVQDAGVPCLLPRINAASIDTLPETEFFANWAGWSVAFDALT